MFFKGRARYRKTAKLGRWKLLRVNFRGNEAQTYGQHICNGAGFRLAFRKHAFEFKKSDFIEIQPCCYIDIARSQY